MSFGQQDTANRPSADAQAMMAFESRRKTIAVAYILWFFFGGVGGHRFYAGRTFSGVAMLALFIGGWILTLAVVGVFVLVGLGIWALVDAFLIPGWIRDYNTRLASELGGNSW